MSEEAKVFNQMFCRDTDMNRLDIGLVNNMPDSALEATERQFLTLLKSAAGDIEVRLTCYALAGVPRNDSGRQHIRSYRNIADLWNGHLDGLIVTGTEPRAANLTEEAFWGSFTELLDWAEHHTYSAIWSCLAAHAAVLHTDGISRRPLTAKRFGIYDCSRGTDHELIAGAGTRWRMPHSRWNEIPEDALRSCDYTVLTRSDAGVDCFLRQRKSLFVYFQGHPEYEANTLLLEYRRDLKRFLTRASDTYPTMPRGYFDCETLALLTTLREHALADRREDLILQFPDSAAVANTWRSDATRFYRNWLLYLAGRKKEKTRGVRRKQTAGVWSAGAGR